MRGIVWDGERLIVTDELEVRPPAEGEVRLRVLRSGICHTDLNMMERPGIGLPVMLGHEAAGMVAELGPGIEGWQVGDMAMVGTQTPCGHCRECERGEPANCDATWGFLPSQPFRWRGREVASFANVSSFAGEIVVKASQLFPIGDLPPEQAALIGCAVSTGYGAARILGKAKAGDRMAVIGVGGIGVNAIAGAALAGAEVLAVDTNPAKEEVAKAFGAGAFLRVDRGMDGRAMAQAMRDAFAPIDTVVECCGAPSAVEGAILGAKRGGRVVLIGMTGAGAHAELPLAEVLVGKEILAVMNGGEIPERDYPELIALARGGKIDLARQVTRVWPLAQVEEAIAALRAGEVTRAVLDHTA